MFKLNSKLVPMKSKISFWALEVQKKQISTELLQFLFEQDYTVIEMSPLRNHTTMMQPEAHFEKIESRVRLGIMTVQPEKNLERHRMKEHIPQETVIRTKQKHSLQHFFLTNMCVNTLTKKFIPLTSCILQSITVYLDGIPAFWACTCWLTFDWTCVITRIRFLITTINRSQ